MFELFPSTLRKKLNTLYWTDPWFSISVESSDTSSQDIEDKRIYTLEVPGYDKEDLELEEVSEGLKVSFKDQKRQSLLYWVDSTRFDTNQTKATCSKGILTIEIPRKIDSQKGKIKIE